MPDFHSRTPRSGPEARSGHRPQGDPDPSRGRGRDDRDRRETFRLEEGDLDAILARNGSRMVEVASRLAEALSFLKAAQIRNFYGSLLKLEARVNEMDPATLATEFQLLRPKLRYMATRESAANPLQVVFDRLLERAARRIDPRQPPEEARQIARCVFEFAEAVVAYHRERRQG